MRAGYAGPGPAADGAAPPAADSGSRDVTGDPAGDWQGPDCQHAHDSRSDGGGALSAAHDTCGSAAVLDLGVLPTQIQIDTNGAHNDYKLPACNGQPDVIARVVNAPATPVVQSCTGGGAVRIGVRSSCPGSLSGSGSSTTCSAGNMQTLPIPPGTSYLIVCRDPAQGPATLELREL